MSNFTPPAQKLWAAIPSEYRMKILNSVWCGHCRETTSMLNITGNVKGGDLVCMANVNIVVRIPADWWKVDDFT
ncbi:MAG: hypothetical protein HGA96_00185 [Desulfobulbaceae bacterium]|nr:hypothetical protein [Desulfobulbaceae bacterium]